MLIPLANYKVDHVAMSLQHVYVHVGLIGSSRSSWSDLNTACVLIVVHGADEFEISVLDSASPQN